MIFLAFGCVEKMRSIATIVISDRLLKSEPSESQKMGVATGAGEGLEGAGLGCTWRQLKWLFKVQAERERERVKERVNITAVKIEQWWNGD